MQANPTSRARAASTPNSTPRSVWHRALPVLAVSLFLIGLMPSFAAAPHSAATLTPHATVAAPAAAPGGSAASTSLSPPQPKGVVFNAPGPRPSSWGVSATPPGWEALGNGINAPPASSWGGGGGGGAGNSTASNWDNRFCAGVWPGFPTLSGNPQGTYASGCYGHDEPGIQFYSTLPGSGGNVSWNVTLPTDRSSTLNQSNLYAAIWFGMTLSDPAAWMDQCFLELQFYPDQTFYNPGPLFPNATVNGAWIGAAVAWQIEASSGFENPCFYEPLYLNGTPGPAFLNMTQGDNIAVTMTGWTSSLTGEQIVIRDRSNGQSSTIVLYNSTGGFPLNPAYVTNTFEGGLQWTPGGEYPVVFAFETGHAGNYNWPSNNTFGGCSPGLKSTPGDPAAPCPSYDPGSWSNDTLTPWKIQTPMFFNGKAMTKAAQVGFTQDFGGISMISQIAGDGCPNAAGSAWCSYPWYSYSCASAAFEFGATDYATFSNDFGKYNQYAQYLQGNALGFGFYPPTNFSVPTCSNPAYTVTVGSTGTGAGAAYFLSQAYTTATAVAGVGPGSYSLNALNSGSGKFDHWVTTGSVTVGAKTSAYTSLAVTGAGTVTAAYSTTARTTKITFSDTPVGSIGLDPSQNFNGPFSGNGNPLATLANGGTFTLTPGIYSVQGYPAAGYVFGSWSVSSGLSISSAALPYAWLIVSGTATTATLTAHYTKMGSVAVPFEIYVVGNGSVTILGHTITGTSTTPGLAILHPAPGTYSVAGVPGTGNNAVQYFYGPAAVMTNFSANTLITVEAGFSFLEAVFSERAAVTLSDSPSTAGSITLIPPFGSYAPSASGTTMTLSPGGYTVTANPNLGNVFSSWSVTGGASVASATSQVTTLTVSTAATLTANFGTPSTTAGVKFAPAPSGDGSIQLDGLTTYASGTTVSGIGLGLHVVNALPAPGFVFSKWTGGTNVKVVGTSTAMGQLINVTGTGSSLTATFAPGTFPFTFVAIQGAGSNIAVKVNGVSLHSGDTEMMPTGKYSAPFAGGGIGFNGGWTATSNITLTVKGTTSASFTFFGSATLYLVLVQNGSGPIAPPAPATAVSATALAPHLSSSFVVARVGLRAQ
jgi:hypothetical protein